MFSTKLNSYPRIIQLASKTRVISGKFEFNLQNTGHPPLACIYTIEQQSPILKPLRNHPNYSTKPIEVPPLPVIPPQTPEADIFGTIGGRNYEAVDLDEDELKEDERLKNWAGRVPRKFKPSEGQYADMIKNYVSKGDLASAERVMLECKKNRDKPSPYMFTLLINAFARHGDAKKCFQYHGMMKARRYPINANVYTSLFNACANYPDSFKALNYLERARDYMKAQHVSMNHAHYNVLVKAYGNQMRLDEAKKLLAQMEAKKMKIGISTINSLMYAANSDVESGLKEVLRFWQLMRKKNIPPNLFTYNLLLRAIRDTHFGDCTVNDLLLPDTEYAVIYNEKRPDILLYPPVLSPLPLRNVQRKNSDKVTALLSPPPAESSDLASTEAKDSSSVDHENREDLPEPLPPSVANLDLDAVMKQNKLILFGGVEGLLGKMKSDRIEPNVKTITYLMELVPGSVAAEEAIIKYARTYKIQLDIDFFNMLIKKRCMRDAKADAKAVLDLIHKADLRPNIVTYGVLALAYTGFHECRELLATMRSTGHEMNKYVADAMLSNAFRKLEFPFILELMEIMYRQGVRLDEETYEKLDEFQQRMSRMVKEKHRYTLKDKFKLGFSKFNMRYKTWQKEMGRKVITELDS